MSNERFKQIYSFVLLGVTIAWAAFCVWITYRAVSEGGAVNILGAAGADALLGSLITWNALIIQHYYRKRIAE